MSHSYTVTQSIFLEYFVNRRSQFWHLGCPYGLPVVSLVENHYPCRRRCVGPFPSCLLTSVSPLALQVPQWPACSPPPSTPWTTRGRRHSAAAGPRRLPEERGTRDRPRRRRAGTTPTGAEEGDTGTGGTATRGTFRQTGRADRRGKEGIFHLITGPKL